MSLAIGPLGRNGEASGTLNTKGKLAAMYSYSKTKGLFGGVSVEGSIIVERQDANAIAYGKDVTATQLLTGVIFPPNWADTLIQTLNTYIGNGTPGWINDDPDGLSSPGGRPGYERGYSFTGMGSAGAAESSTGSLKSKRMPSLSGSLIPGKLRKSGDSPAAREWPSSPLDDAYSPVSPNPKPPSKPASYDVFADENDDDPWGDSPNFRPQLAATKYGSRSGSSTPRFPTHFESDFDEHDQAATNSTRPSYRGDTPTSSPDPFPDLSTSMNAFSFSQDPPGSRRSMSPFKSKSKPTPLWADRSMYYSSRSPTSESYRSDSPDTPASSAAGHPPLANKPVRTLSLRKGLLEPAPPGAKKAVALFDYFAKESGDLSFREGDVIYVTERSDTTNDWWTGVLATEVKTRGIFPANFVTLDL